MANPQSWNRYSYVTNNPLRYTDPTGHRSCSDETETDCETGFSTQDQIESLKIKLKNKFKWKAKGDGWSLRKLQTLYQTGLDIENYVNGLTGGKGNAWMNTYLGNTDFRQWDAANNQAWPGWATRDGTNTVYLNDAYSTKRWIAHELGHIWDINTAQATGPWGAVGGVADDLNSLVGGTVADPKADCRFCEKSGTGYIPKPSQYAQDTYGNNSTADYLAETFTFGIYPSANPGGGPGVDAASNWVKIFIISQSGQVP